MSPSITPNKQKEILEVGNNQPRPGRGGMVEEVEGWEDHVEEEPTF